MAEFRLALDAGHCIESAPDEVSEWLLNDRICRCIAHYAAQYEGFYTMRVDDPTGNADTITAAKARAANSWPADLYYSARHTASLYGGAGSGVIAYCNTTAPAAVPWRDGLYDAIIAATGRKGNRLAPKTTAHFSELAELDMPAVRISHGFMTDPDELHAITSEEYPRQVGEAVAAYIAARAGLQRKETHNGGIT